MHLVAGASPRPLPGIDNRTALPDEDQPCDQRAVGADFRRT